MTRRTPRGLRREATHTARAFARRVAVALPGEAGRAFAALTESYLMERFSARPAADADEQLVALERGLRGAH